MALDDSLVFQEAKMCAKNSYLPPLFVYFQASLGPL